MTTREQLISQEEAIELTDGMLAREVLAGNQAAFEILVTRYSTTLFNFIYHFVGDYDRACDILQQVFLQLYISLPMLRTDEPLKPWLFQVSRNRCVDELRQLSRKRAVYFSELETVNDEGEYPSLFAIPDSGPLPEEQVERRDLQRRLHTAIGMLPPRYRSVVFLRYASQLSFSEIGRALNMPEATAKTYFQRAKPLLRAALASQLITQANP
jgi:RNA polymerase sigma-70 factor (ECF subfamily)